MNSVNGCKSMSYIYILFSFLILLFLLLHNPKIKMSLSSNIYYVMFVLLKIIENQTKIIKIVFYREKKKEWMRYKNDENVITYLFLLKNNKKKKNKKKGSYIIAP